jgi:hypothetical protein
MRQTITSVNSARHPDRLPWRRRPIRPRFERKVGKQLIQSFRSAGNRGRVLESLHQHGQKNYIMLYSHWQEGTGFRFELERYARADHWTNGDLFKEEIANQLGEWRRLLETVRTAFKYQANLLWQVRFSLTSQLKGVRSFIFRCEKTARKDDDYFFNLVFIPQAETLQRFNALYHYECDLSPVCDIFLRDSLAKLRTPDRSGTPRLTEHHAELLDRFLLGA